MTVRRSDVVRFAAAALVAPWALCAGAADDPRRKPDLGDAAEGTYEVGPAKFDFVASSPQVRLSAA